MICASIGGKSYEAVLKALQDVEMAEIRLDSCTLDIDAIEEIFSLDIPLIATCRVGEKGLSASCPDWDEALRRMTAAVKAGARYADLDIDAPQSVARRLARCCGEWGTAMIRSWHDWSGTPPLDRLIEMADRCRQGDGEIVKIAVTAHSKADVDTVLSLYRRYVPQSLVAFAMGDVGRQSRLDCLRLGAPLTYACVDEDSATADGQMTYSEAFSAVYGSMKPVKAEGIALPASKSYAQRAILAAALAAGRSSLNGYTHSGDADTALSLARKFGAEVILTEAAEGCCTVQIDGISASPGSLGGDVNLDVGQSAFLARTMIPLGGILYGGRVEITGGGSLSGRILDGAAQAAGSLRCKLEPAAGAASGADGDGLSENLTLPLSVQGPPAHGKIDIDGSRSSQIVSGALMALPLADRDSAVHVSSPSSIPYLYLTAEILHKAGIRLRSEMYGGDGILDEQWDKCTGIVFKIAGKQRYKAFNVNIERDWGAAAPFLAAGAVFGEVSVSGLDTSSLQADISILDILLDAGASVSSINGDAPVVTVRKSPLQAIEEDMGNCPDLFPVTAVLCAFCQGRNVLSGIDRLRHKESDRASGTLNLLLSLGVKAEMRGDSLIVYGESLASRCLNGRMLRHGSYSSGGDHRMVMALCLAALGADGEVRIDDSACVSKSWPDFNKIWYEFVRK